MNSDELAVRARGLANHLAGEAELEAVDAAADPASLRAALAGVGIVLDDVAPAPVEVAARDRAAADIALLERWAAEHDAALHVIVDDLDRESLRALIRGLAGAAGSEARLAGTLPTSRLPADALRALASATTAAELAQLLARLAHPAAAALAPLLAATPLDVIAAEHALAAWFARRARAAAALDHALSVHVGQVIDVANATAALLLAARGGTLDRASWFLDGGRRLSRSLFTATATATTALAAAFAGTPLSAALSSSAPDALERAALAWHLATQRRLRRQEPLGMAPVLWLLLSRRAEQRRLRRAAWHVAMRGAP